MVKYLKDGEGFSFDKSFGFSGSCDGAAQMARGGTPHIPHAPRKHHRPKGPPGAPKINSRGKLEIDPAVAKGMLRKAVQVGALAGAKSAAGAGAAPPPDMGPPALGGAPPGMGAPPIGGAPPLPAGGPVGMAKGGKFITGAIKKPGQLHRDLGVPQGEKIPASKIASAAKGSGKVAQRARFAQTLKKMNR